MEWSNNGQDGPTDNPWKATEQRPEFHKQEDAHNTKQDNGPEKRVKSQPENNQDNIAGDREIGESGSHVRTEQRNNRIQREDIENESQDPAKNKKEHVLGGETQLKDGGNINAGGMSADKRKAQSPLPEQVPQRSSLDDLKKWPTFRTWRRDDPSGASQISLPSSGSSSIVPSSSLALEQLPLGQSLEQLMVRPENVPLPKPVTRRKTTQQSTEGPRNKNKKKSKKVPPQPHPQLTAAPEVLAYRTDVNLLAGHFSNLRNIAAAETRYDWSTRIVFYDHIPSESDRPRRQEPWKSRAFAPLYQEFYSTLRNVPDDCVQRIILVEDLTPSLIDLLGATFQIPPHVFEEHLDRSGYGKRLEVQSGASAWHTRSSTQGYSSITWYRPVLPLVPMTSKFRKRLILNEKPIVPCIFDGCGHHNLRLSALANIWRHHLELCPDPGVHHKGTQSEYPVGWEERATIWTQDFDNCKFVVLFLDPLLVVVDETTGVRNRGTRQQTPTLANLWIRQEERYTKSRSHRTQAASQAIHVHNWIPPPPTSPAPPASPIPFQSPSATPIDPSQVPSSPGRLLNQGVDDSDPPPRQDLQSPLPPPVNSSSKYLMKSLLPQQPPTTSTAPPPAPGLAFETTTALAPTAILPSAPPLPPLMTTAVPDEGDHSQATGARTDSPAGDLPLAALRRRATRTNIEHASNSGGGDDDQIPKHRTRRPSVKIVRPAVNPTARSGPPPPPPPLDPGEGSLSIENHGPFVPYHPIRTRSSSSALYGRSFTALQMRAYIESLQIPTSTLDEFDHFLQLPTKGKEKEHDPFRALLRAIHDDTLGLVDIIRVTLRRIREGTLDEDLMQRRVTFWRSLLYQLHYSLAEFDQRLQEFVHFAYDTETHHLSFDPHSELPSEKLAKSTRQTLRNCMDLIDRSSDSLRAEMQIVDSRRSIAEAESISKLTELAFVFIPLSFVASLFSMQVHEFDGGVPLYKFVLVAIAFVLVAYAVRLSIRSSRLIEYKNNTLNQIRDEAHLHYNEPIPTRTFLAWFGATTSKAVFKTTTGFISMFAPLILVLAVIAAIVSPIVLLWLRGINKGFTAVITVLLLLLDMILVSPVVINASGEFEINIMGMIREIQRNREINKKRKAKARKRLKQKAGLDPESQGMEDSDSSDDKED